VYKRQIRSCTASTREPKFPSKARTTSSCVRATSSQSS